MAPSDCTRCDPNSGLRFSLIPEMVHAISVWSPNAENFVFVCETSKIVLVPTLSVYGQVGTRSTLWRVVKVAPTQISPDAGRGVPWAVEEITTTVVGFHGTTGLVSVRTAVCGFRHDLFRMGQSMPKTVQTSFHCGGVGIDASPRSTPSIQTGSGHELWWIPFRGHGWYLLVACSF